MKKLKTVALAGALSLLGLVVATPAEAAPVAAQAKISHDLRIKNVGQKAFFTAEHWGWPRTASNSQKRCDEPGVPVALGGLRPGQSSRAGTDTDCIMVPTGYALKRDMAGPNSTYTYCSETLKRPVARKVSPGLTEASRYKRFYLKKC